MGYRLLAVHCHPALQDLLQACVEACACSLHAVRTGSQGLREVMDARPDIVVVEMDLPDMDGLSWLNVVRQTREGRGLPVVVAGEKNLEDGIARAFSLGADDFVCFKSCDPRELTARLRAVLRRRYDHEQRLGGTLELGPVALDPARRSCRVRGKARDLRPKEFELLEVLLRKAGRVLDRSYLLETVWGMSRLASTRTVDVTVGRLRAALGRQAGRWIETVERFGYRFKDPEEFRR